MLFRKVSKRFSTSPPMGRWVDGGSAGGQTPPLLSSRTGWQMCTTCHPLQRMVSASLPFAGLRLFGAPPRETANSISISHFWAFRCFPPLRALREIWLSAWGPFCTLAPSVLELTMGGGAIDPSEGF